MSKPSAPHKQPPAHPQAPPAIIGPTETEPMNPGQAAGIISLLLAFVGLAPFGLVLSIISTFQSRKANMPVTLGVMSIVINTVAVLTMMYIILVFVIYVAH